MELKDWVGVIGGVLGGLNTTWAIWLAARERRKKRKEADNPIRINLSVENLTPRASTSLSPEVVVRITNIYSKTVTIEVPYIVLAEKKQRLQLVSDERFPYGLAEAQTLVFRKDISCFLEPESGLKGFTLWPKCRCVLSDGRMIVVTGRGHAYSHLAINYWPRESLWEEYKKLVETL